MNLTIKDVNLLIELHEQGFKPSMRQALLEVANQPQQDASVVIAAGGNLFTSHPDLPEKEFIGIMTKAKEATVFADYWINRETNRLNVRKGVAETLSVFGQPGVLSEVFLTKEHTPRTEQVQK